MTKSKKTRPKKSSLQRPHHPMPADVKQALLERNLLEAYQSCPPYQQNDYIGWITRAKREATRKERIAQMLTELTNGDRYMKMAYSAKTGNLSRRAVD